MKRKTRIRIAVFILILIVLFPLVVHICYLNSAKADEALWKVRIHDPCNHKMKYICTEGEVAYYSVTSYGMVYLELTDGREYMTHWNNVLMYKE